MRVPPYRYLSPDDERLLERLYDGETLWKDQREALIHALCEARALRQVERDLTERLERSERRAEALERELLNLPSYVRPRRPEMDLLMKSQGQPDLGPPTTETHQEPTDESVEDPS